MKRSELKRSPFKRRPVKRTGVTSSLREAVLKRDKLCFLARISEPDHVCRDQWGEMHSPFDLAKMTLDHVNLQSTRGKRAPDDLQHLVAMCAEANIANPSAEVRAKQREYLAGLYPEA